MIRIRSALRTDHALKADTMELSLGVTPGPTDDRAHARPPSGCARPPELTDRIVLDILRGWRSSMFAVHQLLRSDAVR
jgi:hypothetical protein